MQRSKNCCNRLEEAISQRNADRRWIDFRFTDHDFVYFCISFNVDVAQINVDEQLVIYHVIESSLQHIATLIIYIYPSPMTVSFS